MNIPQKLLPPYLATLFALAFACQARAEIPLGSVIFSRNINEAENTAPGFFNHNAIYVGDCLLVESQEMYGGVVLTRYNDFVARSYHRPGILYPRDPVIGARAAYFAKTYVGRPYRRMSSLAPLVVPPIVPTLLHGTPDGMNCTSVVADAYSAAIGRPLVGLRFPDDVTRRTDLFTNEVPR